MLEVVYGAKHASPSPSAGSTSSARMVTCGNGADAVVGEFFPTQIQ